VQRGVLRTGVTLLVSATVFLGAVMPPAVQHAHALGGQPHDHDAAHSEMHSADHRHPHPRSHHPEEQPCPVTMPTWHFHLTFLGFDFHLPVGDPQNAPKDGPSLPDVQSEPLVRLFDAEGLLKDSVAYGTFDGLPSPGFWSILPIAKPQPRSQGETSTRLLLCDSARGERSGVQLI
jgi:hypothetical protein